MNHNQQSSKVGTQDRITLEKYTKFFALKTVQAVVQSRFGYKMKTRSKPSATASDWFNIAIEDDSEVQDHTKSALNGQIPLIDTNVCIEISLRTAEKVDMVLELFTMKLNREHFDTNISVASVYYQLGLLLKSAIAITRVTPGYRLSRRQSSDSYVILFRIYFAEPEYIKLDEGYQEYKIGEVITAIGAVSMSVACRTKMTITPQKIEKENSFMVKSDYFKPDMSPKRVRMVPNGFRVDFNLLEELTPINDAFINGVVKTIDKGPLQQHNIKEPLPSNFITDSNKTTWCSGNSDEDYKTNSENSKKREEDFKKVGAFAPASRIPDPTTFPDLLLPDTPFLKLLGSNSSLGQRRSKIETSQKSDNNVNLNLIASSERHGSLGSNSDKVDYNCNASDGGCKSGCSDGSDCGDFVMVDLRPPFADCESNTDLGAFYRECQTAPPLASFVGQPTLEEQVTDITSQLARFETSMIEFDHFVDGICQVGDQQ